jgi:hypothetical protein
MTFKPKVALAQDFLANLATLTATVQGKVLRWALRFQSDPTATGINYEPIHGARDGNLKSVRIDQDWRGIVFKPPAGDVYVLMYVDHHDDAYRWAEGRRVAVNPTTGALQVFAVESLVEPALEQARLAAPRPAVEPQTHPMEPPQTGDVCCAVRCRPAEHRHPSGAPGAGQIDPHRVRAGCRARPAAG